MHAFKRELRRGPEGKAGQVKSRRQAVAIALREAGAAHRMTLVAGVHAAAARWAADAREGEALMHDAVAALETRYPAGHPDLAGAWGLFGGLLASAHRPTEARPLLERALAWNDAHFGARDPRTVRVRLALK